MSGSRVESCAFIWAEVRRDDVMRAFPKPVPPEAALLVIDLQKAIDDPSWGRRNNPEAERNIAALLRAWRATCRPIYHIAHDSNEPASTYRPGQRGNEFKPEAQPLPGELVIRKHKNSAFIGTDL